MHWSDRTLVLLPEVADFDQTIALSETVWLSHVTMRGRKKKKNEKEKRATQTDCYALPVFFLGHAPRTLDPWIDMIRHLQCTAISPSAQIRVPLFAMPSPAPTAESNISLDLRAIYKTWLEGIYNPCRTFHQQTQLKGAFRSEIG